MLLKKEMGTNVSKDNIKLSQSSIVDASTRSMSNMDISEKTEVILRQDQNNIFDNFHSKYCGMRLQQGIALDMEVYRELNVDQVNELANSIENELKSDLDYQIEQENKKFNFFQTNVSVADVDKFSEAITDLSTSVANSISSEYNTEVQATQQQNNIFNNSTIECLPDGSQTFETEQKIDIRAIIQTATNLSSVVEARHNAEVKLDEALVVEKSQKNAGIDLAFLGMIIAIIIVVLIVASLLVAYFTGQFARNRVKDVTTTGKATAKGMITYV